MIERERLTSILTGDEIDPLAELDLEMAMAHEVLHSDVLDNACARTTMKDGNGAGGNPRIGHG